jgi:uncharacterized protein (TIRG00374 family)
MSSKIKLLISTILLVILIFIVSKAVKVEDLQKIIFDFPKEKLLLFFALSLIITLLKAWRFLILLRNSNIKISFFDNLKVFIASQAITPLPGGEAMRGVLVHKESGVHVIKTSGPVLSQAFLEVFSAVMMAVILSIAFEDDFIVPSLIGFLIMSVIFILLIHKQLLGLLLKNFSQIKFLKNGLRKIIEAQSHIRKNIMDEGTNLPDKIWVRALGLSLIINAFGGFLIFLIARSYGADLNIFRSIFIYSSSIVISSLATISPGGIGFTEGGMTGILLISGVELPKALGIVLIFRIVTLIFSILLGLIFFGLFYSKQMIFLKPKKI